MSKQNKLTGLVLIYLLTMSTGTFAVTNVVTLTIENMTCKMCDITVRKAIEKVNGVTKATVDYDSKTAQVTFNPDKTNVVKIEEASTMAGYPAKVKSE